MSAISFSEFSVILIESFFIINILAKIKLLNSNKNDALLILLILSLSLTWFDFYNIVTLLIVLSSIIWLNKGYRLSLLDFYVTSLLLTTIVLVDILVYGSLNSLNLYSIEVHKITNSIIIFTLATHKLFCVFFNKLYNFLENNLNFDKKPRYIRNLSTRFWLINITMLTIIMNLVLRR